MQFTTSINWQLSRTCKTGDVVLIYFLFFHTSMTMATIMYLYIYTSSKFCIIRNTKITSVKKWIHFLDIWNSPIHYPCVACWVFGSLMRCVCMPFHLCMSVSVFFLTRFCNCCLLELQLFMNWVPNRYDDTVTTVPLHSHKERWLLETYITGYLYVSGTVASYFFNNIYYNLNKIFIKLN